MKDPKLEQRTEDIKLTTKNIHKQIYIHEYMINEYVENMTEIDRYIYIIYNYIYIRNRCAPGQNIKMGSVLNMLCGSSQSGNEFFDSILYNRLFGAILSCPALLRVLMFRKNRRSDTDSPSLSLERERDRETEREREAFKKLK